MDVDLRKQLVDKLTKEGNIKSEEVKQAFLKVPRHIFIPEVPIEEAYEDTSVITKSIGVLPMSSSTQPSLMASMLEMLKLEKGMKVLEIGLGTGYNVALLSEIVGDPKKIFSVDIDLDTVKEAHLNLERAGYKDITIECTNGMQGLPKHAPYDRIIATCSVGDIPKYWIDQLVENGILVTPLWINGTQITPAFIKHKDTLESISVSLGGFMRIRGKDYENTLKENNNIPKEILICSQHKDMLNEKEIISLLQDNYKEKELPQSLKNLSFSEIYNFFIFLCIHERKSIEIFLEENIKTTNIGFKDSAFGIIDLKQKNACLISRDLKLFTYGNDISYEKVLDYLKKWEELKRPGLARIKVCIYFKDLMFVPLLKILPYIP